MKQKVASLIGIVLSVLTSAAAQSAVPVGLVWNNPGPQYTNLVYNIYWTTNITVPTNLWAKFATNITPVVYSNNVNQYAFWTNLTPGAYFFTATAVDKFWGLESFFSQAAGTPQPLTTPLLNLTVVRP